MQHEEAGGDIKSKLIPFEFRIKLPSPRYERTILIRDEQEAILSST